MFSIYDPLHIAPSCCLLTILTCDCHDTRSIVECGLTAHTSLFMLVSVCNTVSSGLLKAFSLPMHLHPFSLCNWPARPAAVTFISNVLRTGEDWVGPPDYVPDSTDEQENLLGPEIHGSFLSVVLLLFTMVDIEPRPLLVWIHRYRNRWLIACQHGVTTSYIVDFRDMFYIWSKTGYCDGSETCDELDVL